MSDAKIEKKLKIMIKFSEGFSTHLYTSEEDPLLNCIKDASVFEKTAYLPMSQKRGVAVNFKLAQLVEIEEKLT